jgi:hypothetical protein
VRFLAVAGKWQPRFKLGCFNDVIKLRFITPIFSIPSQPLPSHSAFIPFTCPFTPHPLGAFQFPQVSYDSVVLPQRITSK